MKSGATVPISDCWLSVRAMLMVCRWVVRQPRLQNGLLALSGARHARRRWVPANTLVESRSDALVAMKRREWRSGEDLTRDDRL